MGEATVTVGRSQPFTAAARWLHSTPSPANLYLIKTTPDATAFCVGRGWNRFGASPLLSVSITSEGDVGVRGDLALHPIGRRG